MDESLRRSAAAARSRVASGALRGAPLLELLRSIPFRERDAWVDVLLGMEEPPPDGPALPREGVPYLPCGVDEIVAMVREVPLGPRDTLVDLGAGVGRVAMLAHLLSGARARGVEIQAPLVRCAETRAAALGLAYEVSFVHADAAEVELDGSVFFLYTPFAGALLDRVLDRLEALSARRSIVLCAVGLEIHGQRWLSARATSSAALTLYDARPRRA